MKIDGKKILKDLEKEKSDRQRVTLYLSQNLYSDFRKNCGSVAPSQVIEKLMAQFVESVKGKK